MTQEGEHMINGELAAGMETRLGEALRQARVDRGISIRELAEVLGVSASLLSQVERGKSLPSVKTLFNLAAELDVSLDELATGHAWSPGKVNGAEDAAAGIQRAVKSPRLEMGNGVIWTRLATGGRTDIQPLFVEYQPGATTSREGELMTHEGFEFVYIIEGTLYLKLEDMEFSIGAGDSFCFESTRPHLFHNFGSETVRGFWFVSSNDPPGQNLPGAVKMLGDGDMGMLPGSPGASLRDSFLQ